MAKIEAIGSVEAIRICCVGSSEKIGSSCDEQERKPSGKSLYIFAKCGSCFTEIFPPKLLYSSLCVLLGQELLLQLLLQCALPKCDLLDLEGFDSEGPVHCVCCMQHFLEEDYWKLFHATSSLSAFGRTFPVDLSTPTGLGLICINVTIFIMTHCCDIYTLY